MPLPGDVTKITVTASFSDFMGNAATSGTVAFVPARNFYGDSADNLFVVAAPIVANLSAGAISVTIPTTDQFTVEDVGWSTWYYQVSENILFGSVKFSRQYNVNLPSTLGASADLSSLGKTNITYLPGA